MVQARLGALRMDSEVPPVPAQILGGDKKKERKQASTSKVGQTYMWLTCCCSIVAILNSVFASHPISSWENLLNLFSLVRSGSGH